ARLRRPLHPRARGRSQVPLRAPSLCRGGLDGNSTMSERLIIIGNGMAATRLVDELTTLAPGRYAIAVIGDEPSLAYNRVLLSSLLAREIDEQSVILKTAPWWRDRGVTLVYGRRAVEIDTRGKFVRLRGGAKLGYSKLVLATGSEAVRLPLPGAQLPGIVTFRDKS